MNGVKNVESYPANTIQALVFVSYLSNQDKNGIRSIYMTPFEYLIKIFKHTNFDLFFSDVENFSLRKFNHKPSYLIQYISTPLHISQNFITVLV